MIKTSLVRTALAAGLIVGNVLAVQAGSKDTPEDVTRAAEKAAINLKKMEGGLKVAEAITDHMQERAFAVQVLELAKKKDRKGLAELLKRQSTKIEEVRVTSISDFSVEIWVKVNGKGYKLCIGDHCEHPSGKKSPAVFEESLM
jgi:hypothetical protein